MPRPPRPKVCATPGCPADTNPGRTHCPDHDPGPWAGGGGSHRLRNTLRRSILHRDHHTCYLCGAQAAEVDHVTPVAEGGTDQRTNLAAICPTCHHTKSLDEATRGRTRARTPRRGGG